ncbi:hypothetical protein [Xanthomonas prunicola]|nr:hypothetical protein [Xanthomonas prunicola]
MLVIVHGTSPGASSVLHCPVIVDALHRPIAANTSPVWTRA